MERDNETLFLGGHLELLLGLEIHTYVQGANEQIIAPLTQMCNRQKEPGDHSFAYPQRAYHNVGLNLNAFTI